jgi:hypothetical protein
MNHWAAPKGRGEDNKLSSPVTAPRSGVGRRADSHLSSPVADQPEDDSVSATDKPRRAVWIAGTCAA